MLRTPAPFIGVSFHMRPADIPLQTLAASLFYHSCQASDLARFTGTWRFGETMLYVVIFDTQETLQCWVASDGGFSEATGKFLFPPSIAWASVSAVAQKGDPIELSILGSSFSSGTDLVALSEGGVKLSGPFGNYRYTRVKNEIPCKCKEFAYSSNDKITANRHACPGKI